MKILLILRSLHIFRAALSRHHYKESHDYITLDCGGTQLTVWPPGEADRFEAGDNVTVTYNGEPATAYNIWLGQLVSVE